MMPLIALVVGVLPNLPGFLHVAGTLDSVPTFFLTTYSYAWFVGLFISSAVYLLLMWTGGTPGRPSQRPPSPRTARSASSVQTSRSV